MTASVEADIVIRARELMDPEVTSWDEFQNAAPEVVPALAAEVELLRTQLANAQQSDLYRGQYERLMVQCGMAFGWLKPSAFDGDEHQQYRDISHMDVPGRIVSLRREFDEANRAWEADLADAQQRETTEGMREELARLVVWMDDYLDSAVPPRYRSQSLAQDWARVAKVTEEAGEAIDALIGVTGQNPRKGEYGTPADLLAELADVALTGLYAIQHFTKNSKATLDTLMGRARYHHERVNPRAALSAGDL